MIQKIKLRPMSERPGNDKAINLIGPPEEKAYSLIKSAYWVNDLLHIDIDNFSVTTWDLIEGVFIGWCYAEELSFEVNND